MSLRLLIRRMKHVSLETKVKVVVQCPQRHLQTQVVSHVRGTEATEGAWSRRCFTRALGRPRRAPNLCFVSECFRLVLPAEPPETGLSLIPPASIETVRSLDAPNAEFQFS